MHLRGPFSCSTQDDSLSKTFAMILPGWREIGESGSCFAGAGVPKLVRRQQTNSARNRVDFDSCATGADLRAQRMLALLFDHDGKIRADFSARGLGEQMEIRDRGYANFHWTGNGVQIPETVRSG